MKKIKLYSKITALTGSFLLMFTGCGENVEVIEASKPSDTTVSDTTDPTVTSFYNQTEVLESNGTTVYYVTDESGATTYLDENGFVTDTGDIKTSDTTSKISNDTTGINTTSKNDTTTTVGVTTTVPKTTTAKVNTTTTKPTTTASKVTTTKANTTTTVATTTTAKATTTTKTTVTEPPVSDYKLEDIATNPSAFRLYAERFNRDLMKNNGIYLSYGLTFGGNEGVLALAILNEGKISDDVLKDVFSKYTQQELSNFRLYFYNIDYIQSEFSTYVDFTKYTLDKDIGTYLNKIQDANKNGTFENIIQDALVNGNISDKCLNSTAVVSLFCSYDSGKYLSSVSVDGLYMNDLLDYICKVALGHSYTK